MNNLKIMTILGARPQFIKASALSDLIFRSNKATEYIVHTGQHFDADMSQVFFDELNLPMPAVNLEISGGSHAEMTGRMLIGIEKEIVTQRPDVVLVYGDTNSTLAGALAAAKLEVPVAHVEAGLRSFNRSMPEELNRKVTDCLSQFLFTPTQLATSNLQREGHTEDSIYQVGDIMLDVALNFGRLAEESPGEMIVYESTSRFALATIHRAENTGSMARMSEIVFALCAATEVIDIILPLHPRTRAALVEFDLIKVLSEKVRIIEPVGYLDMVRLEKGAAVIITDSGGVQKEAFFHKTPCITLRGETEWMELVDSGWNRLVNPVTPQAILDALAAADSSEREDVAPYGEGDAAKKIIDVLLAAQP